MSSAAAVPAAEAAPKGKKKLLVILIAVVVLLAAGGGGGWFYMHKKAAEAEAAAADEEGDAHAEAAPKKKAKKKKDADKPPVFSTLENFTVNLAGGDHFMQLGIVLQLKGPETAEQVKVYLPQIRNGILLLLSSKSVEDLESAKGKTQLIDEILKTTRAPLGADGDDVEAVLIGNMLVQ